MDERALLAESDPPPCDVVNAGAQTGLVLTCEHGGRALPRALAERAPPPEDMDRHIAWDVGAEGVARSLAERLGAPLAIQPYSRLVIDCNRPRHAPALTPAVSDGSAIPFNEGLDEAGREARWLAIHQPFHARVAELIDAAGRPALVAVHSFAPSLRDGVARPMAVGLLARRAHPFVAALREALLDADSALEVAMNAPYTIDDDTDYTIPVHGEARELPHVLLEIRNDLIADAGDAARWTALIAGATAAALAAAGVRA